MKKKRLANKIISGVLALTMAVGILPMASTTAYAADTDRAMVLGMNGIQNWDKDANDLASTDKIVMGEYGGEFVEWVMLGNADTNGDANYTEAEGRLMFSTKSLGGSDFESVLRGFYSDSDNDLRAAMTNLYNSGLGLSTTEKGVVLGTTLAQQSMHAHATQLTGQKFFPLSAGKSEGGEFHDYVGEGTELAKDSFTPFWWLRSSFDDTLAFSVWDYGDLNYYHPVTSDGHVRPAFNLDLSSVLFTSAAVGGKSSFGGEARPILGEISGTAPITWKMTLLDSTRSFALSGEPTVRGNTVEFPYTGAKTGANEYISVMIVDTADNITHYAKIAQPTVATGTASFTIPDGVVGEVELKIFNEQDNGDNETDYASAFVEKTVTIKEPNNLQSVTQSDVTYSTALSPQVAYNGTQNGANPIFAYKVQGASDKTYKSTAPTYAGDYTVKATSVATVATLEGIVTADFSITAADQTPSITANASVQVGNSIDLSTLVTGAMGTVSFTKESGGGMLNGNTYTAGNAAGTAVFTVNVTGKDENSDTVNEYNPYTGTRAITLTIEEEANTLEGVTQDDVTYGTTLAPEVTYIGGVANGGPVTYSYSGRGNTNYSESATAPTYVGNYTVKATSAATAATLEGIVTADFSITAANQTPTIIETTSVQVEHSIDLSTLVTGAMGTVSFTKVSGDGTLNGNTYTASSNTGTAVFTVNVTEKDENNDTVSEYAPYTKADAITVTITAAPITHYNITFDSNGGSGTQAPVTVAVGTALDLPTTTTFLAPNGMQFKGWSLTKDGEVITSNTFTSDAKVYAIWQKNPPTIVSGANQIIIQGDGAEFKSDADFGDYIDTTVTIDGTTKTIHTAGSDNTNASATEGSIILTLSGAYTETLPLGTHTISINSTNGSASTQFTVVAKEQPKTPQTGSPQTGDANNLHLYLIIALISLIGIGYMGYRKKIENR